MARRRRLGPKDVTQHVIQRGNNRKKCFNCEQDFIVYVSWLKQYSAKFNVDIHAWVLMTNHVHLLCTPRSENLGVSKMMQSLGRQYVRYFNDKYKQTGTLWEGRFKSSLVCTIQYSLTKPLIDEIGACTNKELVLGNDKFKRKMEALIGKKLKTGKMGRPPKQ